MSYRIETISNSSDEWEYLVDFLLKSPGAAYSRSAWRNRLQYWWKLNPAAADSMPRGWLLWHEAEVVGFLGCIPMMYEYQGNEVPAVAATTWRVSESHRGQSLRLFIPLLKLSQEMVVINSSPISSVASILEKSGFHFRKHCLRHFLPIGRFLSPLLSLIKGGGYGFPTLPAGLRVITGLENVASLARSSTHSDLLQRKLTLEYLRWLLNTPMEDLQIVACVNERNIMSSFVVLMPGKVKGLRAWVAIDWFTSYPDDTELLALIGQICQTPSVFSGSNLASARVLVLASFEGENLWDRAPALHRVIKPAIYYYSTPKKFRDVKKYCVLAESDFVI